MRKLGFLTLAACLLLGVPLQADQVLLKNGDRLTGKIASLADGNMVLKSDVLGEVKIGMKDIATFQSDSAIEVHLKDGTVLNQPVATAAPDQFAIAQGPALRPQTFSLADVTSINPPAKPQPKWTGSITGAVTSTHGNTKAEAVTASADYGKSKQTDRDRDPVTGEKAERTTEDWWRARAQYDYFFTKKFFGFMNGRYERDAVAELDRRVVVGGGGGYQWIETPTTNFSTNLGLASLYEKFDNVPGSNSEISLQLGYNFEKRFGDQLRFIHDLSYFPSLEDFSDYFLTSTAELRATLTKSMFANFKVIFNFDESPAPGRGTTDVKYLLGVGVNF
jgi:putative salt-induced outer membrane protein YdiY